MTAKTSDEGIDAPGSVTVHGCDFFPDTSATMMSAIRQGDEESAGAAFNRFAELYSEPLLRYVQSRGVSHDESKDVVQEFFLDVLIRRRALATLDPANWRLRRFLRVALTRYVRSHYRKQLRVKRGGHLHRTAYEEFKLPPTPSAHCVLSFEQDWAKQIMARVYAKLREKFRRPDREALYDALEPHIPWRSGEMPLVEIARAFERKPDAIKAQLNRIRSGFRDFLHAEVSETVLDPDEVNEEIKYLVKILEGPTRA